MSIRILERTHIRELICANLDVVQEIVLSGECWSKPDDFYNALLLSLGAPDWHGHNFDALWDSMTGEGINRVNPPLLIRINGINQMAPECKALVDRFVVLLSEARTEGIAVEALCG